MYIESLNIQGRALYLTGNEPFSNVTIKRDLKRCRDPRYTFGNKLLKNTNEVKQGSVKFCWEDTLEKNSVSY